MKRVSVLALALRLGGRHPANPMQLTPAGATLLVTLRRRPLAPFGHVTEETAHVLAVIERWLASQI